VGGSLPVEELELLLLGRCMPMASVYAVGIREYGDPPA